MRLRRPSLIGLHRAFHDAPLAHAILVDAAFVVDRVERTIEDRLEGHFVRGGDLGHAGRRHEFDIQPLVLEETFVAGDQHGQVMDCVHDRELDFLGVALNRHDIPSSGP